MSLFHYLTNNLFFSFNLVLFKKKTYIFFYQYYFTLSITCFVKGVEIYICRVLKFGGHIQNK